MSLLRSTLLLGASLVGAATFALFGAGAASADSGINFTPGNDGLLNSGTGNSRHPQRWVRQHGYREQPPRSRRR